MHACSLVELILLELLSEVESTQEGHHKGHGELNSTICN